MKQKHKKHLPEKQLMHQHKDKDGQICGQSHPLESKHVNQITQAAHVITVIKHLNQITRAAHAKTVISDTLHSKHMGV